MWLGGIGVSGAQGVLGVWEFWGVFEKLAKGERPGWLVGWLVR